MFLLLFGYFPFLFCFVFLWRLLLSSVTAVYKASLSLRRCISNEVKKEAEGQSCVGWKLKTGTFCY